jgi:hypothetical protein
MSMEKSAVYIPDRGSSITAGKEAIKGIRSGEFAITFVSSDIDLGCVQHGCPLIGALFIAVYLFKLLINMCFTVIPVTEL